MEIFVAILCIVIAVALIVLLTDVEEDHEKVFCGIGIFICGAFVIGSMCSYEYKGPRAIDVYRGNTTLQVTYQDSIPIDSIVVFKK